MEFTAGAVNSSRKSGCASWIRARARSGDNLPLTVLGLRNDC
jgi:hypothetical protein